MLTSDRHTRPSHTHVCIQTGKVLFQRGTVLFPVATRPEMMDLLDLLHQRLAGSHKINTILLSPVVQELLQRVGIHTEWTPSVEESLQKLKPYLDANSNHSSSSASNSKSQLCIVSADSTDALTRRPIRSGNLIVTGHPLLCIGDISWITQWLVKQIGPSTSSVQNLVMVLTGE